MAYLEPGAYSKIKSLKPNTGSGAPDLTPLVMGSGATIMKRVEVLTRGFDAFDVLPVTASSIKSIGFTPGKSDFEMGVDFQLDEKDHSKIVWIDGGQSPREGDSYSVTLTHEVGEDQYLPRLISSITELETYYGTDIRTEEGGEINNLFTAAKIMLEIGAPSLYVLQVKPGESGSVGATQYQKTLDEHAQFMEEVWRIVPVDLSDAINGVIDGHIRRCSSYEERKERCVVYAKAGSEELKTPEEVISSVGGYAQAKANDRVTVPYPTRATKTFSDEIQRELTGQFIAAAYAGLEASMPKYMSKTRSGVACFDELLGVQLTRSQKNKLAECGVLILEQPAGAGSDCIVRHQLTTNMNSAEYRENSVLACKDYVSKYLRQVCETYIGKYNITSDTITRVTGSINAAFASMISDGWILEGQLKEIAQDEYNPDTLLIEVYVKVPYPCNYIKITVVVD